MWNITCTHQNVTSYTNSLVFEWLGVEIVNFYIFQHKIFPECSVYLSPEYVILDDFCIGTVGHKKINHLIFFTTLSNQCCQPSYFPQWSSNICLGYDKSRFTTVTCIPELTACSWSKHWNWTVHYFYYSATDIAS